MALTAANIDLDSAQGGYGDGDKESTEKALLSMVQDQQKPLCTAGVPVAKKGFQAYSPGEHVSGLRKKHPDLADTLQDCFKFGYAFCPSICGMTPHDCEQAARKCIDTKCKSTSNKEECEEAGSAQLTSTKMFFTMKFTDRQFEACQCVPHAEADRCRREELSAFYAKWAPDQQDKLAALLKKYADRGYKGWSTLMFTLHQKYTRAVKLLEADPGKWGQKRFFNPDGTPAPPPAPTPQHTEL